MKLLRLFIVLDHYFTSTPEILDDVRRVRTIANRRFSTDRVKSKFCLRVDIFERIRMLNDIDVCKFLTFLSTFRFSVGRRLRILDEKFYLLLLDIRKIIFYQHSKTLIFRILFKHEWQIYDIFGVISITMHLKIAIFRCRTENSRFENPRNLKAIDS